MNSEYNKLITETFCNNAIRSVMIIDDDFFPYSKLVEKFKISENETSEESKRDILLNLQKAAALHSFFQEKHMLCDLDQGMDDIQVQRIRKSDLIILDYHLEYEDPSRSIRLLQELRDSDHLNLVVIYTREDLNKAWFETATSFRGRKKDDDIFQEDESLNIWNDITESGSEEPANLCNLIDSDMLESYILSGAVPKEIKRMPAFSRFRKNASSICEAVLRQELSKFNILNSSSCDFEIAGSRENSFWIQTGNLFVTFYSKSKSEIDDPQLIWDSLQNSLCNWNPSFYRLITSEIQNTLENKSLSFSTFAKNNLNTQVGWLSKILSPEHSKGASESLQDNLFENIELAIRNDSSLQDYINRTIELLKNKHIEMGGSPIDFSRKHIKSIQEPVSDCNFEIYHCLNQSLSTINHCNQIKTGTVLVEEASNEWFICVSPSCDIVPMQHNQIAARIKPHRSILLARLSTEKPKEALENATHSNYIFLQYNGRNMTFSFLKNNVPILETIIVNNFDNHDGDNQIHANTPSINEENKLIFIDRTFQIITQLRSSYAQRFQAITSHHQGRIGVDFIPYKE